MDLGFPRHIYFLSGLFKAESIDVARLNRDYLLPAWSYYDKVFFDICLSVASTPDVKAELNNCCEDHVGGVFIGLWHCQLLVTLHFRFGWLLRFRHHKV